MNATKKRPQEMPEATYSAYWEADPDRVLYEFQASDNLFGMLPAGAMPHTDPRSTLDRKDGGDPWEFAVFICQSGRVVIVERD